MTGESGMNQDTAARGRRSDFTRLLYVNSDEVARRESEGSVPQTTAPCLRVGQPYENDNLFRADDSSCSAASEVSPAAGVAPAKVSASKVSAAGVPSAEIAAVAVISRVPLSNVVVVEIAAASFPVLAGTSHVVGSVVLRAESVGRAGMHRSIE